MGEIGVHRRGPNSVWEHNHPQSNPMSGPPPQMFRPVAQISVAPASRQYMSQGMHTLGVLGVGHRCNDDVGRHLEHHPGHVWGRVAGRRNERNSFEQGIQSPIVATIASTSIKVGARASTSSNGPKGAATATCDRDTCDRNERPHHATATHATATSDYSAGFFLPAPSFFFLFGSKCAQTLVATLRCLFNSS